MSRPIYCALLGVLVFGMGCGGDDGSGPSDAGPSDAGPAADAPADAGTTGTPTTVLFLDTADDEPLPDVKFAVDVGGRRVEGVSDGDGLLELVVPAEIGETISWTAALERYVIRSVVDAPFGTGGVGESAEPYEIRLSRIQPLGGERTSFTIEATGVPAGGRLCASHARSGGTNWSICNESGGTWSYPVPIDAIGDAVNAWLVDTDGTPIDFERIAIPEGETTVDVAFDGTFDTDPETRTVRIGLPGDAESPLRTATLSDLWQGWFTVSADGQQWSVATNPRYDGSDLVVDVAIMAPPAGADVRHSVALYADLSGAHGNSFAYFTADPGSEAQVMGLPTVVGGDSIHRTFTIAPPDAIGDDALMHILRFRNSSSRAFWAVMTERTSDIALPELPTGYDRTVSFPFDGAMGTVVVQSLTMLEPGEEPGVDRDAYFSFSEKAPVAF